MAPARLLAAALLLALPATVLANPLTLPEALRAAGENARQVRIRSAQVRKAQVQHQSALTNLGPKVLAGFDYQHWDSELAFKLDLPPELSSQLPADMLQGGVVRPRDTYTFNLSVVQPLTGLLTIGFGSKLAALNVDQARVAEALDRHNARLQAVDAFFGVLRTRRQIETLESMERTVAAHLEQARRFLEQGLLKQDDVLRIEVRLEQVRQGVTSARVGLDVTRGQLALLVGRPLGEVFEVADTTEVSPLGETLDASVEEAVANRWEVRQARLAVDMARTARVVKGLEFLPTVNGLFTYSRTKETQFSLPESWFVGLNASWTIFEWGRKILDLKATAVDVEIASQASAQVEDLVRLDVRANWLAAQAAWENIARSEVAVRQSRENLRIQTERARERMNTTTDVLDAESLVLQAENDRSAAVYGYLAARTKLLESLGRER